jgi:hypothetical protein
MARRNFYLKVRREERSSNMSWLDDIKDEEHRIQEERKKSARDLEFRRAKAIQLLKEAYEKVSPIMERLFRDLEKELGLICKRPKEWSMLPVFGKIIQSYYTETKKKDISDEYPSTETPGYIWWISGKPPKYGSLRIVLCLDDSGRAFLVPYWSHGDPIYVDIPDLESKLRLMLKEPARKIYLSSA